MTFSIKQNDFAWRVSVTWRGIRSFLIWKWKFIKVNLMNLESKLKVYYIRRDVSYKKTSTQRLERERGFSL